MADEPKKLTPPFEWVDTPQTAPVRVRAVRWKQAGHEVCSALCPTCRPGVTLEQVGKQIHQEGHGHVHTNGPGRIIHSCGTHLELYVEEEGEA